MQTWCGIAIEFLTSHWRKENRKFARSSPALSKANDARHMPSAGLPKVGMDESILCALAKTHGLEMPMERLIAVRNERFPDSRPRYWAVVNFDLRSDKPRLFVLDVAAQTTQSYFCAHGIGSEGSADDGIADIFSNEHRTKTSSLGIYLCAETFDARRNGYALRLDGLEPSNSNARPRHIVMHGADYVSKEFIEKHGRIGQSKGCPAVDRKHAKLIIDQLKWGSLLIHWRSP